jgi:uncharacterized protein YndB with AHSA1/START domain
MTAQHITPAPVRKSVVVNANAARAFDLFANNISRWWPVSHTVTKSPLKDTIIEPFVKGRWYQVGEDGLECDNGHVLAWEPPHRLVLAWQLNPDWQFDPNLITEVEVKFIAEGERKTRVELEHRYIERMGEKAEAARNAVDSPNGWGAILEAFRQVAEQGRGA